MSEHPVQPKPKVLVLCQLFYPELVSTGQTLTELCEVLVELGIDVEVLCGPSTIIDRKTKIPKYLKYKGIKIKRVWGTRFPKLSLIGKVANQMTYTISIFFHMLLDPSKKPVLVLTNPPFLGGICSLIKKLKNRSFIYLVFDVYPDTPIKLGLIKEKGWIDLFWNLWNRFVFKNASEIIVIGRCMRKIILSKAAGIDSIEDKIHLIHIWGDDRNIHPVKREKNRFIKKWNLEKKFVVSYSGNMGRFHDLETIMMAAKEMKERGDIEFLFIGEGYKKKWMQEYASQYNLKNCQFHTYVKRNDLSETLSCAHVGLVSLKKGQEGLSVPSKIFGLLAAGVPVVCIMPQESEIALIVKENKCGFVVNPEEVRRLIDAILKLKKDKDHYKITRDNALKTVNEKYSLKSAALKYKDLIKKLQYENRFHDSS